MRKPDLLDEVMIVQLTNAAQQAREALTRLGELMPEDASAWVGLAEEPGFANLARELHEVLVIGGKVAVLANAIEAIASKGGAHE